MNWIPALSILGIVMAFLLLKRSGQVRTAAARQYLREGAQVIDVRTEEEFQSGHLPLAINIPLDVIQQNITVHAPNRDQVLLLHCQAGVRSGMARTTLRRLGYTRVFNLGSYQRAESIVRESA